ncbi:MAG: hypothetical protein ACK55Z_20910, partial [bacterium]
PYFLIRMTDCIDFELIVSCNKNLQLVRLSSKVSCLCHPPDRQAFPFFSLLSCLLLPRDQRSRCMGCMAQPSDN